MPRNLAKSQTVSIVSTQKLKIGRPYDLAITVLGIYSKKTMIHLKGYMHPNAHCSIVAIGKTWKPSQCPLTEEWIKKMWYIYTMECYLAIKKNEIMPFVAK